MESKPKKQVNKDYNWKFVESIRTAKKTGVIAKSLKIYLCIGNKVLRESEMNSALHFEREEIEKGNTFENSMNDFLSDQQMKMNSPNPEKYKSNVHRMNPSDFKKWRAKEDDDKQASF